MKKITMLLALSLSLVLAGCKTTHPIYNANAVVTVSNLSNEDMKRAIVSALMFKRWHVIKESENKIIAGINVRSHYAEIAIDYNNDNFSINYVRSSNLDYDASKNAIHRNYNKWIQLLENEIQQRFYMMNAN